MRSTARPRAGWRCGALTRVPAGRAHHHHLPRHDPVIVGDGIAEHARRQAQRALQPAHLIPLLGTRPAHADRAGAAAGQRAREAVERVGRARRASPRALAAATLAATESHAARAPRARRRGGGRRHPGERGVDAVPEPGPAAAGTVLDQAETHLRGADALEHPHVLRPVQAPARHGDLVIGLAHGGVEHPALQHERGGGGIEAGAQVQLVRRPGRQPFGAELGEPGGIAGGGERLAGRPAGGLVLPVPVARRAAEDRHDDLRTEPADHPHDILQDRVAGPVAPRFLQRLGVPEVVGAGEELAGAVQPAGGQQLLAAEQPERLAELGSDEILPPLAAVEREVRRLRAHAAHQHGEQLGVLVVGVRPDHEHPLVVPEHAQLVGERDGAAGGWRLELGGELGERKRGRRAAR